MKDISKELSRTKILFLGKPGCTFFSTVCLSMETIVDDSIGTACTNGKYIKYNPDFYLGLTEDERIFLMAHETLHVVFMHMIRRNDRNPYLWNVAADYVINAALKEHGFSLIEGALYDKKYEGLTSEEVYDLLVEEGETIELPYLDVIDADCKDGEDIKEHITDVIVRASVAAQMAGDVELPKAIKRLVTEILHPTLPWDQILKRFIKAGVSRNDYSWKRPKQRGKVYLPRLHTPKVGEIDISIDTSGSVSARAFNKFLSEVYGVLKSVKPSQINVSQWDHHLRGNSPVKDIKDLQRLEFTGGGGTRASCAFNAFAENSKSLAMVIISDGYIASEDLPKETRPVIWAIYNNENFVAPNPKHKVIHIKL